MDIKQLFAAWMKKKFHRPRFYNDVPKLNARRKRRGWKISKEQEAANHARRYPAMQLDPRINAKSREHWLKK